MVRPKIFFSTSFYLQLRILMCPYNYEKINKFRKDFEKFFRERERVIMKNIPKLTGIPWKRKSIQVWLFEGWYPSISDPLLLNVHDYDKKFVLFNLIHELIHVNLMDSKIPAISKIKLLKLEALVSYLTVNVATLIFSKREVEKFRKLSEFHGYYYKVWKKVKELENIWDPHRQTLVEFVKKECRAKKFG